MNNEELIKNLRMGLIRQTLALRAYQFQLHYARVMAALCGLMVLVEGMIIFGMVAL